MFHKLHVEGTHKSSHPESRSPPSTLILATNRCLNYVLARFCGLRGSPIGLMGIVRPAILHFEQQPVEWSWRMMIVLYPISHFSAKDQSRGPMAQGFLWNPRLPWKIHLIFPFVQLNPTCAKRCSIESLDKYMSPIPAAELSVTLPSESI